MKIKVTYKETTYFRGEPMPPYAAAPTYQTIEEWPDVETAYDALSEDPYFLFLERLDETAVDVEEARRLAVEVR